MVHSRVQLTGKKMRQSNKEALVEYIKLIVESRVREAHLTGGRISEWGSSEHIADLDEQIAEIQKRKSRHGRGSAVRAEWAKVEARLRAELKSAHRHASQQMLSEKDGE